MDALGRSEQPRICAADLRRPRAFRVAAGAARNLLVAIVMVAGIQTPRLSGQNGARPVGTASEYEVKAAFLLNFARFVEWPAPERPNHPITICVFADDDFRTTLERLAQGEAVNGRPVIVSKGNAEAGCQILFVGSDQRDAFRAHKPMAGVLTVGEGPSFLRDGGMIDFVIENRRVRFDVNLKAAQSASVRISSRLLGVARTVVQ